MEIRPLPLGHNLDGPLWYDMLSMPVIRNNRGLVAMVFGDTITSREEAESRADLFSRAPITQHAARMLAVSLLAAMGWLRSPVTARQSVQVILSGLSDLPFELIQDADELILKLISDPGKTRAQYPLTQNTGIRS